MAEMTAEQFERWYVDNCGVAVEELRGWNRVVRPCDCGDDICEGWQMIPQWLADEIDARYSSQGQRTATANEAKPGEAIPVTGDPRQMGREPGSRGERNGS